MLQRSVRRLLHQHAFPSAGRLGTVTSPLFHAIGVPPSGVHRQGASGKTQQPLPFPHRAFAAPSEAIHFQSPQEFFKKVQNQGLEQRLKKQPKARPQPKEINEGADVAQSHPRRGDFNEMPPEVQQMFHQIFGQSEVPSEAPSSVKPTSTAPPSKVESTPQRLQRRPAVYEGPIGTPSCADRFFRASTVDPVASATDQRQAAASATAAPAQVGASFVESSNSSAAAAPKLGGITVRAVEFRRVRDVTITGLPDDCIAEGAAGADCAGCPILSMELDEVKNVIRVSCQYKPTQAAAATENVAPRQDSNTVKIEGVAQKSPSSNGNEQSPEIVTCLTEQPPVYIPGASEWRCEIPVAPATTLDQITPFFETSEDKLTKTLRLAIEKTAAHDVSTYAPKKILFRQ